MFAADECKICGSKALERRAHTARCQVCGVLLYYPYPTDQHNGSDANAHREQWHDHSAHLNHDNFTRMLRFAIDPTLFGARQSVRVLDYGGGGGQFAMVCKSLLPRSEVFFVDIADDGLLDVYRPCQKQILWREFRSDQTTFDYIFLNDVYEHLSDPVGTLALLKTRLSPHGKIFIDTPKQFWLYPLSKAAIPGLHLKLLRGTVSQAHVQIWSRKAFDVSCERVGLTRTRYKEIAEFTRAPSYYLRNMGITNPVLTAVANAFYGGAKWFASNKILAVLEPNQKRGQS